jgi:hypothetical protein
MFHFYQLLLNYRVLRVPIHLCCWIRFRTGKVDLNPDSEIKIKVPITIIFKKVILSPKIFFLAFNHFFLSR